ncbi:MAG: Lrp/AsnC ligand binding domain-containing protein [Methanomassiliicoccales archaeon]
MTSFMLINTNPKKIRELKERLMGLVEVSEIYALLKEYDLLLKIDSDEESIVKYIRDRIGQLEGVQRLETFLGGWQRTKEA